MSRTIRVSNPPDRSGLRRRCFATATVVLLVLLATACSRVHPLVNQPSTSGKPAFMPPFHPSSFHRPTAITNPWFPVVPGTRWIWHGQDRGLPMVLEQWVTNGTRLIDGVVARAVMDKDIVDRQVIGGAVDYYAQDDEGNVWYLGEQTTHYVNGRLTDHADTWIAGINRSRPGIFMPAHPHLGSPPYQQEFAPNLAADVARVAKVNESVCVPLRCFHHAVEMDETTVLEPGVLAAKYYAPGTGLVRENVVQGDPFDYSLVSITPGA